MNSPKVRFVVFRYSHHSPHSGYSRIAEYGEKFIPGELLRFTTPLSRRIVRERILWKLANGTPAYDRLSMAAELGIARRILLERGYLYHILYGERTYHYTGRLNGFGDNRIIATFHLPPDRLRNAVQIDWHIRQLSAVICVGNNQREFFDGLIDPARVFFVPLGVDVEYYQPPTSFDTRDPNICLIVGENYRDYPTLRGVIELVSYQRPETRFIAVMPEKSGDLIGEHPNFELRSGIPESELLSLYHKATIMLMPLKDATANNAILESMACGVPLVVSDVGAIRDYVIPEGAALIPLNDSRGMAETVLSLLDDFAQRERMALQAREQALKFSWMTVIEQMKAVYAAIR